MTELLKAFLRPLRSSLLPTAPPNVAQTTQERELERNVARMRGFTYLQSMDEVLTWDEGEEGEIQRASLPLIKKPPRPSKSLKGKGKDDKANTMIIHDFGNAYHPYESCNQIVEVNDPPFSLDTGQLRYCDLFVYFAHYLVSCPAPGWVDWCHGNGVRCLGTFIVEPQMGKEEMRGIFKRDVQGRFVVAGVLGRMARWVGFEGWIVNIEGTFGEEDWDVGLMVGFLEELRMYGDVVWYVRILIHFTIGNASFVGFILIESQRYDALTTTNKISHQNALTTLNLPFVLASTHFLTNYTWNPSLISSSLSLASKHNICPKNIYFGIDIWAQNRPHSFLHPRLTWPLFNGGGTNTGFAVGKCAEMGVSAGLFAPGWCWEHFSSTSDRRKIEDSLWRGIELDGSVKCECKAGFWGGDIHRTKEYLGNGIARWAEENVVGGKLGFWTEFERAFGFVVDESDGKKMVSQLGAQGIMPLRAEDGDRDRDIWWTVDDERPGILSIVAAKSSDGVESRRHLKLYKLGVRVEENTRLVVRYSRPPPSFAQSMSFRLKIHSSSGETEESIPLTEVGIDGVGLSHTLSTVEGHDATIMELGIIFIGNVVAEQELLRLTSLSIGSPSSFPSTSPIQVTNIQITPHGRAQCEHGRLTWHLSNLPERPSEIDYWSRITGSVAYFKIRIDGAMIGRAYGLEFVLPDAFVEKWKGEGIVVELCGVLFGGAKLEMVKVALSKGVGGIKDKVQLV